MEGRPPNFGKPWSTSDNHALIKAFKRGDCPEDIADALGRNVNGLIGQLVRLRKVRNEGGKVYKGKSKVLWYDYTKNR